jgi:hypothetical protein
MNTRSQSAAILAALQAGDAITPMDALHRFNCMRLGARIKDLKDGKLNRTRYDIQTVMVSRQGKRFAQYRLMTPRLRIIEEIAPFPPAKVETKPSNSLF